MVASMTGFGSGCSADGHVQVTVDVRSVNHRHLDVRFRWGHSGPELEAKLLGHLREHIERGHIEVKVAAEASDSAVSVHVDAAQASAYFDAMRRLNETLGVAAQLSAAELLQLPGVIAANGQGRLLQGRDKLVEQAFEKAIDALRESRDSEGARLVMDINARLAALGSIRRHIEALAAGQVKERRSRLRTRIEEALDEVGASVDHGRLEQELAHLADRTDITEELVRLGAHLDSFETTLASDGPVGKKLGFLSQELLREVNTIGSKAQQLAIIEQVVAAKVEVEKIREQLLNLE